jgi:hypothetical protein
LEHAVKPVRKVRSQEKIGHDVEDCDRRLLKTHDHHTIDIMPALSVHNTGDFGVYGMKREMHQVINEIS